MAKAIEKIFKESDEFVLNVLKESTTDLNNLIDNLFKDFKLFEKNGGSINEIIPKDDQDSTVSSKRTRVKKQVLTDITENNYELLPNIKIKQEKLSIILPTSDDSKTTSTCEENVDPNDEKMPAPKKLPPRKRKIKTEPTDEPKRSTRTKKKSEKAKALDKLSRGITSDVVIQNTTLITVDITNDSDKTSSNPVETSETESTSITRCTRSKVRLTNKDVNKVATETELVKPTRSTRTKTVKRQQINTAEEVEQLVDQTKKKSKSSSEVQNSNENTEANKTTQTEYEDAVSTLENENEQIEKQPDNFQKDKDKVVDTFNSTFVLEKPTFVNNNAAESDKNKQNSNTNSPLPTKKKHKEIFSPYEKSSTKTKIEAFEKLGTKIGTPLTKSQNQTFKSKMYTPTVSKLYSSAKTSKKLSKCETPTASNNVSLISTKSHSALKASQAEFREREMRRQEKEREALKKRDALLHALTETKRKKREEKMLKAQQQRELLEQENQKKMETQKMKQEKYEQIMAEKEERARQQREESEKKRLLVKKKAEELKEKTKEKTNEAKVDDIMRSVQKEKIQIQHPDKNIYRCDNIPIYMITPAPLLPTYDCYDSDESEYHNGKSARPYWSTDRVLSKTQLCLKAAGEKIINTFFSRQIHTPNLQEIFETIDPRKLKRTSSAVWKKPPRYTLFSETSHIYFSEEEDDDY